MKRRPSPEARTAYHEAGHAVISVLLGRPFEYVTIIPDELTIGKVHVPGSYWSDLTRDAAEACGIISLGGLMAEVVLLGDMSLGCAEDIKKANDLASSILAGVEDRHTRAQIARYHDGILDYWQMMARDMVETNRVAVEGLAAMLLADGHIDYREASEIVEALQEAAPAAETGPRR